MYDGCEYHTSFTGSTTTCIKHLKKTHKINIQEPELSENLRCSEQDAKILGYLLVMYIITSGLLFFNLSKKNLLINNTVKVFHFEQLKTNTLLSLLRNYVNNQYSKRKKIRKLVRKDAEEKRNSVKKELELADKKAITTDWTIDGLSRHNCTLF